MTILSRILRVWIVYVIFHDSRKIKELFTIASQGSAPKRDDRKKKEESRESYKIEHNQGL